MFFLNKEPGSKLRKNKLYAKLNWLDNRDNLFFTYNEDIHEFVYYRAERVSSTTKGWKAVRSGGAPSRMVLNADNLVEVRWDKELGRLVEDSEITIKSKEYEMEKRNVNYIGGEYYVVKVTYVSGTSLIYNFKVDKDVELKKDDLVVVEASNGYGLCTVVDIVNDCVSNAKDIAKATAWVVSKVDNERHEAKKQNQERYNYIKTKLEEKSKQMEAIKMYQLLAELDPEAKSLLDEMKQLVNTKVD